MIIFTWCNKCLSPVHTCHKMAPLNGTIKLLHKIACLAWENCAIFMEAILLLNIEHVLFRAINCCHVINIKRYCCGVILQSVRVSLSIIVDPIVTVGVGTAFG